MVAMSHLTVGSSRPWKPHFDALHKVWRHDGLVLCLGAGVSAPYGLPNWNDLVLDLLLQESELSKPNSRRGDEEWSGYYPNYRRAFAAWLMAEHQFRADVLARLFNRRSGFLERVRGRLYKAPESPTATPPVEPNTLTALVDLIRDTRAAGRRLAGVITLNFDDLLEQKLRAAGIDCHPVYRAGPDVGTGLPIGRLHGFLPQHDLIPEQDLVFTEDQFHGLTVSPFHWAVGELAWHLRKSAVLFVG